MAAVSVAQAAQRLGVSVARVHQRIADGSIAAERIGAQWVVDEHSLLLVQERRTAGRPLSARSAWAVIAVSDSGQGPSLSSGVAARARHHLARLLDPAGAAVADEVAVAALAVALRSVLRNRAQRRLFRVAPADLEDLRDDPRWATSVAIAASGIASRDVEGYLGASDLNGVVTDYLLVEAEHDANVVLHVTDDGQFPYPKSRLRLAADLAEHRGPREELRAAELLHELALEWKAVDE